MAMRLSNQNYKIKYHRQGSWNDTCLFSRCSGFWKKAKQSLCLAKAPFPEQTGFNDTGVAVSLAGCHLACLHIALLYGVCNQKKSEHSSGFFYMDTNL